VVNVCTIALTLTIFLSLKAKSLGMYIFVRLSTVKLVIYCCKRNCGIYKGRCVLCEEGTESLHSTIYIPHSTFHILYSTFYIPSLYFTFYISQYTFYILHYTFYIPSLYSTFHIPHSTFYIPRSIFHILIPLLHFTFHTPHSAYVFQF
jgi:hypothetical protein